MDHKTSALNYHRTARFAVLAPQATDNASAADPLPEQSPQRDREPKECRTTRKPPSAAGCGVLSCRAH
ncbi:hypothetical protein OF001_U190092 [Pseudomonas sp. OF001]|nr:hypothetical protein OF001_U190092 [Pseudomonas sp. OF001]